jgi:hypothetical protein
MEHYFNKTEVIYKNYSNILKKINTKSLHSKVIEYQKQNPCCKSSNNCTHPKFSTDEFLNKKFKKLENSLLNTLKDKEKIKMINMWAYITFSKQKTKPLWHNHVREKHERVLSNVCYLTPTKIGTEFKNGFVIKPQINYWYTWDGSLLHRPIESLTKNTRIVIAADVYF